ncbi:hypothetical protein IVB38_22130 [Bradyrhizobium sp. 38]|uniref:hypothetical protein n=1 Tax=unclassified Bradyrhizobium TaxID=2631580 RepID=UPI001FF8A3A8|nr:MULTISPECIES: hypothetical protein [unclassified Bradyrhizobium]MCK1338635.1 hypothetical protein [Bradyrhizobium sp. 38]MCK1776041.1 hypothetical protein [Bradyrhizobium sp. 132]
MPLKRQLSGEYAKPVVDDVTRAEGYKEFRCIPAHWLPSAGSDLTPYAAESLSTLMAVQKDPDFWSASDAAMRARHIAPASLDERELAIMATRRSNDYNRVAPWASSTIALACENEWGGGQDPHVHPFANLPHKESDGILGHYGMTATIIFRAEKHVVVTGMGIRESKRAKAIHEPWHGGIGTWLSWQTINGWQEMHRRQDIPVGLVEIASEGRLLLFISHRWETPEHPDPAANQIKALKTGLLLALCVAIEGMEDGRATHSGLPEIMRRFFDSSSRLVAERILLSAWAEAVIDVARTAADEAAFLPAAEAVEESLGVGQLLDRMRSQVLLWYDYASMYQAPRADEEERTFRNDLRLLNRIQASATTVVIADDQHYLGRAWCFLEVAGGIRNSIAELTPSWSRSLDICSSANKWMHITDQLIGALNVWGTEAIPSSGLVTTHAADLPIVAELISELPLVGLVESDGMDLIGGSMPISFTDGVGWVTGAGARPVIKETLHTLGAFGDYGRVPSQQQLARAANDAAADKLTGGCAVWIYATQRVLALAWMARRAELLTWLNAGIPIPQVDSACATWADSLCLAEDGNGWTRFVPSSVKTLIIVTQADLPDICILYTSVLKSHLAAGCTVITVTPETGVVKVEVPDDRKTGQTVKANALVVPRIRRSTAYPSYLLLGSEVSRELVERAAWLRLEPTELARATVALSTEEFASLSVDRVLVEAECRTTLACWEALLEHGLDPLTWRTASGARQQIDIVRQIVAMLCQFTENPLLRRRLLYAILENDTERGQSLPGNLPRRVQEIINELRAERPR